MDLLNNLADINFAEKDTALIESEVISYFEKEIGRKLYAGDPLRLLLLSIIKYLALQRSLIDFSGKQNLLKYATDGYLQNIGALVGTYILEPSHAVTTLKFTLSKALDTHFIIPKGTRATSGDNIYFATINDVEIAKGEIDVEVNARCNVPGIIGNGYYIGQINIISDPFPYSASVENITITQDGSDIEDLEAFRERIRLAPESFSTAGPYGAYEFWAKTASQNIIDVAVTSPSPGVVEIVPLLKGGEIPTEAILDEIYSVCSDSKKRPLTDFVKVRPPEEYFFKINLKYYIARSSATVGASIQTRVIKSITDYILWQKSALMRDLNVSKLIEMVMSSGVKRVEVIEPVFTKLTYYQIAVAEYSESVITYGGLEDD